MSDFMKLNWKDLLHGLIMVVISSVLTALLGLLQSGSNFGVPELKSVLMVAVISGLSYLVKKLTSDQDNKVLGKL